MNQIALPGFPARVDAAVILGSGLGGFTSRLDPIASCSYSDISGFPDVTVPGHGGNLHVGRIGGKTVLAFSGRFHHYEGHDWDTTLLPVRLAHAMGAKTLIVSNAAGGINLRYQVGDLMLIDDLLRVAHGSGSWSPGSPAKYMPKRMIEVARRVGLEQGIELRQGTYLFVKGPVYETPAEIRAYRYMGADAVGMSTLAELQEASRLGMACLGITLVTNMASGVTGEKLDHAEIQDVAEARKADFARLVEGVLAQA